FDHLHPEFPAFPGQFSHSAEVSRSSPGSVFVHDARGRGRRQRPAVNLARAPGLSLQRMDERDMLMAPRTLPNRIGKVAPVLTLVLVAFLAMPSDAATKKAAPKATGNPFDILKGYWTGGGTVTPVKGNPERVSCKVTYMVAGASVSQTMRCAGTDYKFNTSSK